MDIKHEIRRLVPAGALEILRIAGIPPSASDLAGDADVTVLFTDIADSTALTERLGDRAAREIVLAHDAIVRGVLAETGGREIKHTGDGLMTCFASAARAIEAAVRIERQAREWNDAEERPEKLRIAIGLNAGSPIIEEGDLFGTVVNLASRITDCAAGEQVLVSDVVRQLAAGKGFLFRSLDARSLDGIAEPVPLYEVVWQLEQEEQAAGDEQAETAA